MVSCAKVFLNVRPLWDAARGCGGIGVSDFVGWFFRKGLLLSTFFDILLLAFEEESRIFALNRRIICLLSMLMLYVVY